MNNHYIQDVKRLYTNITCTIHYGTKFFVQNILELYVKISELLLVMTSFLRYITRTEDDGDDDDITYMTNKSIEE